MLNTWASNGELDPDVAANVAEIDSQLDRWAESDREIPKDWLAHQIRDVTTKLQTLQQLNRSYAPGDAVGLAKKIKSSPIYRDPGPKQTSNWLANAFERLNNAGKLDCKCKPNMSTQPGTVHSSSFFIYGIYVVFISVLAGFIIFAISKFSWSKKLQRKAKSLLDEDEPDRSLDEWLEMADKLEREGRYREAVRCLYLACLLKIDEARIARFERSQTNWEHLERIEASPTRPANLEFREATKAFDIIWYGMQVDGSNDVMRFRNWYREVTQAVRPREAA
jgi:hypothetical protein